MNHTRKCISVLVHVTHFDQIQLCVKKKTPVRRSQSTRAATQSQLLDQHDVLSLGTALTNDAKTHSW